MTIKRNIEFYQIIEDIIKNKKFINLKEDMHHGITRLDHSLSVAKTAYFLSTKLKMKNYVDVTRAALLHDFYNNEDLNGKAIIIKHPQVAALNATKIFNINDIQINAIKAHMFPLGVVLPKYKESWLVNIADKFVATYECIKYKLPLKMGTISIFLLNFLGMPIIK